MMPPPICTSSINTQLATQPKKKRRRTTTEPTQRLQSPVHISPTLTDPQSMRIPDPSHQDEHTSTAQSDPSLHQAPAEPQDPSNSSAHATFSQSAFSPFFSFSPWAQNLSLQSLDTPQNGQTPNPTSHPSQFDHNSNGNDINHNGRSDGNSTGTTTINMANTSSNHHFFSIPGMPPDQHTPGGMSANGSTATDGDKDPFLTLLEQIAENDNGGGGGPSDLDFFLSSGQG